MNRVEYLFMNRRNFLGYTIFGKKKLFLDLKKQTASSITQQKCTGISRVAERPYSGKNYSSISKNAYTVRISDYTTASVGAIPDYPQAKLLNKIIRSSVGKTVYFGEGTWWVEGPIFLPSGCTLLIDKYATLVNLPSSQERLFYIVQPNVTIQGEGRIIGNIMHVSDASDLSEHQHCISIGAGSDNTVIRDIEICDWIGDGIYVGASASDGAAPGAAYLDSVYVHNNNRNNLSVTWCHEFLAVNSRFDWSNNRRKQLGYEIQLPACGIDVEPNKHSTTLGVKFLNCAAEFNHESGLQVQAPYTGNTSIKGFVGGSAEVEVIGGCYDRNFCLTKPEAAGLLFREGAIGWISGTPTASSNGKTGLCVRDSVDNRPHKSSVNVDGLIANNNEYAGISIDHVNNGGVGNVYRSVLAEYNKLTNVHFMSTNGVSLVGAFLRGLGSVGNIKVDIESKGLRIIRTVGLAGEGIVAADPNSVTEDNNFWSNY